MPVKSNRVIVSVIGPTDKRRLNAKGEQIGLRIDSRHEDVFKFAPRG
jgi:hypothetical protein